jgi:AbrB family looped-hinge helix DNA binding protein
MALTKLTRNGQVTLPAEARRKLRLAEGDYLEAEVVGDSVVLRPVSVVDREKAWDDLMAIVERPKWRGPGPEPSEDETMDMIVDEIHAMRRENAEKSRSR